jgi:carbonic anhydrase
MQALLDGVLNPGAMPHMCEWLKLVEPVRLTIESQYSHLQHKRERESAAGEENVLFALENLRTYPCVQMRLEDGSLHIHGWFFKIDTAELFAYDPEAKQFTPLIGEQPELPL